MALTRPSDCQALVKRLPLVISVAVLAGGPLEEVHRGPLGLGLAALDGPRLQGIYCISSKPARFARFKREADKLHLGLPVQHWLAVDGFNESFSDDMPRLVESRLVEPAALPPVLVKEEWRDKWRRDKLWRHVRREREAPGRKHGGWLFGLDLTRGALAHALSHLELWDEIAKKGRRYLSPGEREASYLVMDENCRFLPGFSKGALESRLQSVPGQWRLVFLGGSDMLGGQAAADHEAGPGVRHLNPWFRMGTAYMITSAGAREALRTCTPLRWRLDCQLVGYHSVVHPDASKEERLFAPTFKRAYSLAPPLVVRAEAPRPLSLASKQALALAPGRSLSASGHAGGVPLEQEGADDHVVVSEESEQQMFEELDTVVAWSMRLTDRPLRPGSIERIWHPDRQIEGHSGMIPDYPGVMRELAAHPGVRTIAEVGLNGGHSALRWLLHSRAQVYSFDLGDHVYARPAARWLASQFPGRINVTFGDSFAEVPKFRKEHQEVEFDVIFIDGGHSQDLARADIRNFAPMANPLYNRVIMDDTFLEDVRIPWQEMIDAGHVEEIPSLSFAGTLAGGASYGFSVGRYTAEGVAAARLRK